MKISLNWLGEYLEAVPHVSDVAEKLTQMGLEIEGIEALGVGLDHVVVGQVKSIEKHPNADKLKLCQVDVGEEVLSIVCGAPNVQIGEKYPLARVGAQLNGIKIKKTKIRGVESLGMLCSEKELNVGEDQSGLFILPDHLTLGTRVDDALSLKDTIFELGITPNRGDCLSIRGVAREISAAFGIKMKSKAYSSISGEGDLPRVIIENFDDCSLYGGAVIRNVSIKPSPFWVRYRLHSVGLRAINNIVDITNYILWDIGQPMHAFDMDLLQGSEIIVRRAREGEKIKTLDESELTLSPKDLVISDESRAIALAGCMGGANSSVTEETKNIFLESAQFFPSLVRKTSSKYNLKTDSSYRFERGIDPESIPLSLKMASAFVEELADGEIFANQINLDSIDSHRRVIAMRNERCNKVLGCSLTELQIEEILKRIEVIKCGDQQYEIPSYRNDLEREIDLIEEVARVVGYDNITSKCERLEIAFSPDQRGYQWREKIDDLMVEVGLVQAVNYAFVHPQQILPSDFYLGDSKSIIPPLSLSNPLSPHQSVMRNSLLPGLVENFKNSRKYKVQHACFFETGAVFEYPEEKRGKEDEIQGDHLAIVAGGDRGQAFVGCKNRHFDYYDLKGWISNLLLSLKIKPLFREMKDNSVFAQGQVLVGDDQVVYGVLGEFKESFLRTYQVKEPLFGAEIDLLKLYEQFNASYRFQPINRLPFVKEDISFLIPQKLSNEEITSQVWAMGLKNLEKVEPFDIYRGKEIPSGMKSVAYSFQFRSKESTLEAKEVQFCLEKIKAMLGKTFQAEMR